jgi:hypothetical protein
MRRALALLCVGGLSSVPAAAAAERDALRGEATLILLPRCGKCHDGALATAKPAALAVFDLVDPKWPDGLSDAQFGKMAARMKGVGAPEPERARIDAFIAAERATRRP